MNDHDPFEKSLAAAARSLRDRHPAAAWKDDILKRARAEAQTPSPEGQGRRMLPPRWLLAAWCGAWVLTAVFHLTTPRTGGRPAGSQPDSPVARVSPAPLEDGATPMTLLALHRQYNTDLEIP